jgi:hypothetical protein
MCLKSLLAKICRVINMRTGQPIIGRPAWYDRNPASKRGYLSVLDAAPHSLTTRISYTCPSGKKAMVELLYAAVIRKTAPTTVGRAVTAWYLTPSGGTEGLIMEAVLFSSTVGDSIYLSPSGNLMLFPGDTLTSKTFDGSTGGTCDYQMGYKITEFDA